MISAALRHWRPVLRRTYQEYRDDHVSIVASGVAFRVVIAIFPAIALLVWLATEVLGSTGVRDLMQLISGLVPDNSSQIITQAIHSSLHNNPADRNGEYKELGAVAPIVGLAFMIYSANSGMRALFNGLNLIYDTEERRSFVRLTAITLLFTAGTLLTIALLAAGGVMAPVLLEASGFSSLILLSLRLLRWPVLFVGAAIALALLYRYAPHRDRELWPLVTFGSTFAALLIVLCTALFSWFTDRFASLAVTYGSLSAMVGFMLWLWACFWIVLTCAELDSCIEAETGFYTGNRARSRQER